MTTSSTGTAGAQPAPSGFAVSERTAHLCAETALFMRDHVLSLVSHDLRGPLNAIHSWAYVLERKLDANDPNAQRAVTGIRNGVDQQVKLLETIVDATRAETKSLALAYASFPLHPLLDETVEDVRTGLARSRQVEIALDSQLGTEQLKRRPRPPRRRAVADAHVRRRSQRRRRHRHAGHACGRDRMACRRQLRQQPRRVERSAPCRICSKHSLASRPPSRAKPSALRGCSHLQARRGSASAAVSSRSTPARAKRPDLHYAYR